MVKEFLSQRGVAFEERDVSTDPVAGQEMVDKTGQMGVPVTLIDGQTIIGFDRPRLEQALAKMQKPAPGLGAAVASSHAGAGAYVGRVRPGSAAERLGLQPGDIIVKVNRQPVASADDLKRIVSDLGQGAHIYVTFARDGSELTAEGIL